MSTVDQAAPRAADTGDDAQGRRCPACGAVGLELFHRQDRIPSNSCVLLDDPDEARGYPRGDLELGLCTGCGFITNTRFDAGLAEYSARYEETQGFSARFTEFARDLAGRWVDRYDLRGRHVLEIGCGKGEFLEFMVAAGAGRGTGIDPGVNPARTDAAVGDRITWIPDFYSERYAHLEADAVVCRHTLEHIAPVGDFMRSVRAAIGDRTDTAVLFELPDVARVLQEVAFWDVYYEHCSYFSAGSLARLFRATGFEVLDVCLDYDDQYLLIEARPATTPGGRGVPQTPLPIEDDLAALQRGARGFGEGFASKLTGWQHDLARVRRDGRRAVIWGSGSKGVSYLNGLGLRDEVEYAVDINPYKHGKYMAGTGQRIVAPEFLVDYRPDIVVAMNPVYRDEIRQELDRLGVRADLVAV